MAQFFTSDDGVTWTQLGATVTTAGATSIFDNNAALEIGTTNAGTAIPFAGDIYRAQVYNGIDGTLVADFNPEHYGEGSSFASLTTGETWTLNGSAVIQ